MAVNEAADDGETVGIPVASAPPYFTAEARAIGRPWSTGLYDCQEHQTNGIIFIFIFVYLLFFLTLSLYLGIL